MKLRYLLVGGHVHAHDGDRHYIGPRRLAELYRLPIRKCVLAKDEHDARRKMLGALWPDLVVLHPDPMGYYLIDPDYLALRAAVAASPSDDTPWLVLADWCDDHDRAGEAVQYRQFVAVRSGLRAAGHQMTAAAETVVRAAQSLAEPLREIASLMARSIRPPEVS